MRGKHNTNETKNKENLKNILQIITFREHMSLK